MRRADSMYTVLTDPTSGNLVDALNNMTNQVDYSNQDATKVIQYAIGALRNGGRIKIEKGTYTLSSSIMSTGTSGIEIFGAGNSTVLRLANSVNDKVIRLTSVKDWHIHDLQIDGNKANQASTSQSSHGISAWNCTNVIVERNYVHDCRTFGIAISDCADSQILNNYVKESGANGITIDNEGGGGGIVVQGNVVDGGSDVGITAWAGKDLLIADNQIMNIDNNDSPFGGNGHLGMMAEGTSTLGCTRVTYKGNTVTDCAGSGFSSCPGATAVNTDIVVENNQINNCGRGVCIERTNGLLLKGNLIDTTNGKGIAVSSPATGVQIVGNKLYNIGGPSGIEANINGLLIDGNILKTLTKHGIVAWGFSDWVVTNNNIESVGNSASGSGIVLGVGSSPSNNWNIANNTILNCANEGIRLDLGSSYNTMKGNVVSGCATGIRVAGAACQNNVIASNNLSANKTPIIDNGTGTAKSNNVTG
jgi:parallel beta-helix repeat protein